MAPRCLGDIVSSADFQTSNVLLENGHVVKMRVKGKKTLIFGQHQGFPISDIPHLGIFPNPIRFRERLKDRSPRFFEVATAVPLVSEGLRFTIGHSLKVQSDMKNV